MEPRVNVITLAVDDLERALVFYRDGLGLQTDGVIATDLVDQETGAAGAIVIFKLESGLILALYPRTELAKDAAVHAGSPDSGQFSLGQLVASRAEVDRILEQAAAAGAVVTPPHDRPWGIYSGYFRDPDGHLWEIMEPESHIRLSRFESGRGIAIAPLSARTFPARQPGTPLLVSAPSKTRTGKPDSGTPPSRPTSHVSCM
jgi:hypothetical protein